MARGGGGVSGMDQSRRADVKRVGFLSECRATMKLALPLISGQLSQMLMGVVDTVMIGKVGVVPLAASTFANNLQAVPFVVAMGLLGSVSVRVSQAKGAGAPAEAGAAVRHGSWLALFWWLLMMALLSALLPFLDRMGQPAEVVANAPSYLILCSGSLLPALLALTWKSHADAMNHPWIPFWIGLGAIGLNVVFNWVLIYGNAGFPALGLEGAGWATLAARVIGAVVLFVWINQTRHLKGWLPQRWLERCRWAGFVSLLKVGVPASIQLLAEVTAFVAASLMIGTLGVIPLAAHQVALTCAATSFMVPLGVAMATTVRVGEIVGAQERHRLRRVLLGSWLFGLLFMSVSMTVFLVFGRPLAAMFVEDPAVIKLAATLLIVAGLFQLFDGIQVISAAALRGMDDVKVPAALAAFSYWGIALPFGWYVGLHLGYGAVGIWATMSVGLALAAALLGGRAWRLLGNERRCGASPPSGS